MLDTQEVGGSKPPVPTKERSENKGPREMIPGAFWLSMGAW